MIGSSAKHSRWLAWTPNRDGYELDMVDLEILERLLKTAAREERPVTYGQLLGYFGRKVTRITVSALCRDLGIVCRRVEEGGGPDLACLVVRKSDGMPGEGYFSSLRHDEGYDGPNIGPQAHKLVQERQRVAFAWAKSLSIENEPQY